MDDGDLIEFDSMDLDLNREPYGSILEPSHRIEERSFSQLGPVTSRVRQRQRWRLMMDEGSVPDDNNANARIVERVYDKGKGYKRDSSHLVTQALAMDSEMKKIEKEDGSFYDCNICLDLAKEPVLTSCGHLFCWPCFYQALKVQSTLKQCPVCKGEVSDSSVIPIYGNGDSEILPGEDLVPPRPKARRVESIRQQPVLSHVPVSEAIMQILRIGGVHSRRHEQDVLPNSDHNTSSSAGQNMRMHQVSRVLSESAASLSSLSSAMNNAERLVVDLEAAFSRNRIRLNETGIITATNASNRVSLPRRNTVLNNGASFQSNGISSSSNGDPYIPLHRRLGLSRILERDSQDNRESRRRRLN